MCPLRQVEGHRAGPNAVGILVPPGRQTLLIVRPRSLAWDLVLLKPGQTTAFCQMGPTEANAAARELHLTLQEWTTGAAGNVEGVPSATGGGFWIRVCVGPFVLLACARQPGQPYQPVVFPDAEKAGAAARQLRSILCPPSNVEQEVYLNTRHFTRETSAGGTGVSPVPG
jgi:hypothetical protein